MQMTDWNTHLCQYLNLSFKGNRWRVSPKVCVVRRPPAQAWFAPPMHIFLMLLRTDVKCQVWLDLDILILMMRTGQVENSDSSSLNGILSWEERRHSCLSKTHIQTCHSRTREHICCCWTVWNTTASVVTTSKPYLVTSELTVCEAFFEGGNFGFAFSKTAAEMRTESLFTAV